MEARDPSTWSSEPFVPLPPPSSLSFCLTLLRLTRFRLNSQEHTGEVYTDILGWKQGEVTIGEDGWADFTCNPMSVSIWVKVGAKFRDTFDKE